MFSQKLNTETILSNSLKACSSLAPHDKIASMLLQITGMALTAGLNACQDKS